MIKASELRIGNLVNVDMRVPQYSTIDPVEQILSDCVIVAKEIVVPFGILTGIPLTPEILEKCGFEPDLEGFKRIDESDEFEKLFSYGDGTYSYHINDEYTVGSPFKYIHQLQNLYFVLTGEELALNF